ncbi:bifunctional bis(5'-adenosyl)-triphosphatase/adenylylsulfatase FHIT [Ananas comosus]|uniref:Bis(5'-adenosyl)-triphosphatase n=1 Tax=Ananas comosus TaxID=4615 RepID=A0A6P5FWM7_ANACO|nr:bifunctional bis(5'-adenosyl)-triphosphatase/adenylylsulfatase FHIT [Ananas comosus]
MVSVLRSRGLLLAAPRESLLRPAFRKALPPPPPPPPPLHHQHHDLLLLLLRRNLSCARSPPMEAAEPYIFGPYKIDPMEVFYSTPLSYAMVNLRPVLPGHVLVCSRREVKRFIDLTTDETNDLWLTAKEVGRRLEDYHKASSLTFTIQDGPQAGQTVPHVHIHILPRRMGDFEKNDEIYDAIDEKEKELKEKLDLDKERKDRTKGEMAHEASEYRALFS